MFGGAFTGPGSLEEGDRRASHPRFQAENLEKNLTLVEPVRDMAAAKGCSPATVALAWVLAKGADIVPIPGTRKISHLEDNAAAQGLSLSAEEVTALDEAFPPGAASGERYPPDAMKHLHK